MSRRRSAHRRAPVGGTCVRAADRRSRPGAVVQDRSIYERAEADHEAFWAEQADRLTWFKRWDTVMELGPALGEVVRGRHS